jgi:hypothetical protein
MPRLKEYDTPYTGDKVQMEAVFQEYLACVAESFGAPYDDRDNGSDISADSRNQRDSSLRAVCKEFNISIAKARKLLITAGVYSTARSRLVAEFFAQGKSLTEIMSLTGLSRSSVDAYLPYTKISYNQAETSRYAEDSQKYRARKKAITELHDCIIGNMDADTALWDTVVAYQNYSFYTSSGLPFSYVVKQRKNGDYSGELIVSRKEGSKTLTKSSILLAFHKVVSALSVEEGERFTAAPFKGPKAIGQIFGISYVYSMFWTWGLISVPPKVEQRLRGNSSRD